MTLITKRQAQTLTPEEHQELIHLTEESNSLTQNGCSICLHSPRYATFRWMH